jgi:dihydrofolate synthase/folylpolyglutamate synthase
MLQKIKKNNTMNKTEQSRYHQALDFLFSQLPMFSRVGAAAYKPGLDTSLAIDAFFSHPHRKFKSIHVGGTNGKGSTSHMLAAILQKQGYRVGLYTSPHLVDFRERMRVNGQMIPEESVIEFVDAWRNSGYEGHPSFFELTMMMAFNWFAKENVDYAIIEVGMGGRLDSTNIITPEVCVITNISNDHTQFLGDTLPKIAAEKAGIIKHDIPVVIGEAEGEIREVFAAKAASVGAPITFAEDSPLLIKAERCEFPRKSEGCAFPRKSERCGGNGEYHPGWLCTTPEGEINVPLPGDYQRKNINTVLHAVKAMREAGIPIDSRSVVEGMQEVDTLTGLRGRWTILGQSPLTIADTGHNVAGITYNMAQLRHLMATRSGATLRIVIGFVADKAIDKILKLLPSEATYYLTNASIPRALPAADLKLRFNEAGLDGRVYPDVKTAYAAAQADASPEDIIFVGGSTFIVADLLS